MKRVLFVEDEEHRHRFLKEDLGNAPVDIVSALTIRQAEEIFAANPDFDLIIMDACVEGGQPDTLPLVRKIRETFKGPMIAASGNPRYRQWLMEAGCDHESISKHNTHLKILEVLGL